MSIATDQWTGFMLLCAMRYCMGRQSYAIGICCEYLSAHWNEIDHHTRATMRRDLADELRRYDEMRETMGADFDDAQWRKLLAIMGAPAAPPTQADAGEGAAGVGG